MGEWVVVVEGLTAKAAKSRSFLECVPQIISASSGLHIEPAGVNGRMTFLRGV